MMEPEMREKAKNAMRLILEAARFDVEEVDEPLDLSAVREGVCLLVLCSNEKAMISQFDKTNYSLMIDDHEMNCKKLLSRSIRISQPRTASVGCRGVCPIYRRSGPRGYPEP